MKGPDMADKKSQYVPGLKVFKREPPPKAKEIPAEDRELIDLERQEGITLRRRQCAKIDVATFVRLGWKPVSKPAAVGE